MEYAILNWVAVIPEKEWNDWVSGKTVASFKRETDYPEEWFFDQSSLDSSHLIPTFIPAEKKREENRKLLERDFLDEFGSDLEVDLDTLDHIDSSLYNETRGLSIYGINLYISFTEYQEITNNDEVEEISASYFKIPGYVVLCEVEEG